MLLLCNEKKERREKTRLVLSFFLYAQDTLKKQELSQPLNDPIKGCPFTLFLAMVKMAKT